MVLLDYVAEQGPAAAARGDVDAGAVGRSCARPPRRVGVAARLPGRHRPGDHRRPHAVPARRRPGVDLIDWNYPGHSLEDGLDKLSPKRVDAVGETVLELILRLQN